MLDSKNTKTREANSFSASFAAILEELTRALLAFSQTQIRAAVESLLCARRVFFVGAGRSRLALEMAAMRMMHLGLHVYVVGEVVTPAIECGDLLVVASASGTTAGPVRAARVAKDLGAGVLALTTEPASELGTLANALLAIPAANKHGDRSAISIQYGGTLFEQTVLMLMDILSRDVASTWPVWRGVVEEACQPRIERVVGQSFANLTKGRLGGEHEVGFSFL